MPFPDDIFEHSATLKAEDRPFHCTGHTTSGNEQLLALVRAPPKYSVDSHPLTACEVTIVRNCFARNTRGLIQIQAHTRPHKMVGIFSGRDRAGT